MKYCFLIVTFAFLLMPGPLLADTAPPQMKMRHMSVTATPGAAAASDNSDSDTANGEKTTGPVVKALSPEDALKKTDTLVEWPYYADLMTIGNDTGLKKIIQMIDRDPGSVPPKGLFYAAKALSDKGEFEKAAFYFYAGQLRATFDMARFPPYTPQDKKPQMDSRTQDQRGSVPARAEAREKAQVNPHEAISMLALSIGQPIAKWAMAEPERLEKLMAEIREWDLATPYAYKPDYDISHAAPFETWPQLLTKTRNDYFTRVRQIAAGLRSVKPSAPSPNFTRPD